MEKVILSERGEYDYCKKQSGLEPLIHSSFDIAFPLRIELQKELFPKYSRENNKRFYRWYWDNYPKQRKCEETGQYLFQFSPCFISHILSRGAHPEMAYDARNINLLSFNAHQQWGDSFWRKSMKIFKQNEMTIQKLRDDYNGNTIR